MDRLTYCGNQRMPQSQTPDGDNETLDASRMPGGEGSAAPFMYMSGVEIPPPLRVTSPQGRVTPKSNERTRPTAEDLHAERHDTRMDVASDAQIVPDRASPCSTRSPADAVQESCAAKVTTPAGMSTISSTQLQRKNAAYR